MTVQEAVKQRILELATLHDVSINKLAEDAGLHPSSLKATVKEYAYVKNTGVTTIFKITQALNMPFKAFFESPLFDEENLGLGDSLDDES